MSRDDILEQYRDRITAGARTRLTSTELEKLIQAFIDQLKTLDSRAEIDQICADEIALLEEGYPQATVAKNYIPRYRRAILAATDDGSLPLTDSTLIARDYHKRNGDLEHFHGHYAYTKFKYSEEYANIAEADNARNNQKQDNLKPIDFDRYLTKARELLASTDHNELAVGIAAVSGRRFSEVIQHKFSRTGHSHILKFSGQLKKRQEAEPFLTLCLISAADVWKAIQRFRKLERIQHFHELSTQQINSRMNKSVQRVAHREFGETGIVPTLEGEISTTIHNLRAVYAIAAIHLFCPPSRGDHRFLQEQLGHVIGKQDLQRLRNSSSTAHYFHYFLVDASGKHIGSKGVLLEAEDLNQMAEIPEIEAASTPAQTTYIIQDDKFMDSLNQLTSTIGYLQSEAQEQKQRAEALQAERDRLALEVQALRQELDEIKQSISTQSTGGEPLQQRIASLEEQNATYRAKLEAFQRLLNGSSETATIATPSEPAAAITVSAITPASSADAKQRRRPGRKSAQGKLEAAVRFLQERNEDADHEQMWAITQSIIGGLTGSNISLTVKPFWKTIEQEMNKYNSDRLLNERKQNYGRADDLPQLREEFEIWLDAQPS